MNDDEIQIIPIDRIRILNPRHRDPKKFRVIVESIRAVGLKKPIQVSHRAKEEGTEPGYDLVCGQGRIEAFQALGFTEIAAIVVEVSKEDRLLRSLVENIARRMVPPLDLIREIVRLKGLGYSNLQIAAKLNIADPIVGGLITLNNAREERLMEAAITGKIPLGVAVDIAKTDSIETQRELLKAYETKQLNQVSIRTVKRLMDRRRFFGKGRGSGTHPRKGRTSAEGLVTVFRREHQRQKALVRKAKICEQKLIFVVTAFEKLLADENFVNLLRAESLSTVPKNLSSRIKAQTDNTP